MNLRLKKSQILFYDKCRLKCIFKSPPISFDCAKMYFNQTQNPPNAAYLLGRQFFNKKGYFVNDVEKITR